MTERLNYMKSKQYIYLVALLALVIYFYYNNSLFEKTILDNILNLENYYIQNPNFFMFAPKLADKLSISAPVYVV